MFWGVGALVLVVVVLVDVPTRHLLEDGTAVANVPWYVGAVSQVGLVGWALAASVALFAASVLAVIAEERQFVGFFLAGGLLTVWLMVDDMFRLHEDVLADAVNVDERVTQAMYAAILALWIVTQRHVILRTRPYVFVTAFFWFALSLLLDISGDGSGSLGLLLEDGTKLLGILTWAAFFWLTARDRLLNRSKWSPTPEGVDLA
ncbi:MAG: hypothetical protein JJLCMIEE_01304 [Acidimicrobiales bacterium]|nr:MAG: hypothetical protein EDR02_06895 [Actinomycetota bacterium]MBV6508244.1 hypothetical protein [Acidimicrobiales bacterium]RIK07315.1 MAG: hypothetical protein DCC48_04355 [Acidobacteriota bacterium]